MHRKFGGVLVANYTHAALTSVAICYCSILYRTMQLRFSLQEERKVLAHMPSSFQVFPSDVM